MLKLTSVVSECKPLPSGGDSTNRMSFSASVVRRSARAAASMAASPVSKSAANQGLTLIHLSAQLEPCLTPENTLHTIYTP